MIGLLAAAGESSGESFVVVPDTALVLWTALIGALFLAAGVLAARFLAARRGRSAWLWFAGWIVAWALAIALMRATSFGLTAPLIGVAVLVVALTRRIDRA